MSSTTKPPRPARVVGYGRNTVGRGIDTKDGRTELEFHLSPERLGEWFDHAKKFRRQRTLSPSRDARENQLPKTPLTTSLNIVIHIVGSRGDVQPFIPIAQKLIRPPHNHRVRIGTHPNFKKFVEENGVEFFSIGGDPEALMSYMVKNPGLLPGKESVKAGDIGKRRKEMAEIMDGVWRSCIEAGDGTGPEIVAADVESPKDLFLADMIISNPPAMGHIHCAERLGIPLHMVFTMPWSPTEIFHHPLVSMDFNREDNKKANFLSFAMMELLTWQG
jgi:sterol 3beta-glucosyltransferase